jgi:hypothetical protein
MAAHVQQGKLPSEELVEKGIRDLESGIASPESLLVSIGAPQLRRLGLEVSQPVDSPEHRLYELLRNEHGDAAHSRYNALVRRLVSYERAAGVARAGRARARGRGTDPPLHARAGGGHTRRGRLLPDRRCYRDPDRLAPDDDRRQHRARPEQDEVLRAIPRAEGGAFDQRRARLAGRFHPASKGWRDRGLFIDRIGRLAFRHFDPHSQALAKLERGHTQDLADVRELLDRRLVDEAELRSRFNEIEPELYRFPAVDPADFRISVEGFLG